MEVLITDTGCIAELTYRVGSQNIIADIIGQYEIIPCDDEDCALMSREHYTWWEQAVAIMEDCDALAALLPAHVVAAIDEDLSDDSNDLGAYLEARHAALVAATTAHTIH